MSDPLHSGLSEIADSVAPADMLERSLRRSKRIGQQRAMAAAGGVAVVAAAAVGVTLQLRDVDGPPPVPASSISAPATSAPPSSVPPSTTPPSSSPPSSPPVGGSVTGLPGWLYYDPHDGTGTTSLGRLDGGKLVPIATGLEYPAISPDGTKIAGLSDGKLIVTDGAGGHKRTVASGFAGVGYEPVWSPGSDKVLVAKGPPDGPPTVGTVSIAGGTFTPLAHNPGGIHYLWSADGKHLGYTKDCKIGIADADGGNAHIVSTLESCDPFSISPDGSRIAADVIHPGDDAGDIAPNYVADTLIDTTSGKSIAIPVTGEVRQLFFRLDGTILVRSERQGAVTLTLLNSDLSVRTSVAEPAVAKTWVLTGYR